MLEQTGWCDNVQFLPAVVRKCNKRFFMQIVLNKQMFLRWRHDQDYVINNHRCGNKALAKDIEGLWEPSMRLVDQLLEDEQLLDTVYEAQDKRHAQSRCRGHMQTPAEVVLRLSLLKNMRNWGYHTLEREVRANPVYRAFTRIGDETVPDAKTLARLGHLLGPEVIALRKLGVRRISVPNKRSTRTERKRLQRQKWFRRGQKWSDGVGGPHKPAQAKACLRRCLYRGFEGMQRWVGLGVIADNIIQMGCCLALQSA